MLEEVMDESLMRMLSQCERNKLGGSGSMLERTKRNKGMFASISFNSLTVFVRSWPRDISKRKESVGLSVG